MHYKSFWQCLLLLVWNESFSPIVLWRLSLNVNNSYRDKSLNYLWAYSFSLHWISSEIKINKECNLLLWMSTSFPELFYASLSNICHDHQFANLQFLRRPKLMPWTWIVSSKVQAAIIEIHFNHRLVQIPPYESLNLVQLQMGIGSPKRHLSDRQFCLGVFHTFCKQWPKGPGKVIKFWPQHSVRQNVAGFRRGLFTCFLGHTP